MTAKKKVLIIEDDLFLVQMMQGFLEENGYAVIIAENGAQGLDLIKYEEPHLILCDRCMPKLSGYFLLEFLRTDYPQYNNIPFIFLTNLVDSRDIEGTLDLKPTAYLTKPIDSNKLLSIVKSSLSTEHTKT